MTKSYQLFKNKILLLLISAIRRVVVRNFLSALGKAYHAPKSFAGLRQGSAQKQTCN